MTQPDFRPQTSVGRNAYPIRVEFRLDDMCAYYDFVVFAWDYDSVRRGAASHIQARHGAAARIDWRGYVAFVNCQPAEETCGD